MRYALGMLALSLALSLATACTSAGPRVGSEAAPSGGQASAAPGATPPTKPLKAARMGFVGKTLAQLPLVLADETGILGE
jgi:hypothetical protein